jgi:hypothetical protein
VDRRARLGHLHAVVAVAEVDQNRGVELRGVEVHQVVAGEGVDLDALEVDLLERGGLAVDEDGRRVVEVVVPGEADVNVVRAAGAGDEEGAVGGDDRGARAAVAGVLDADERIAGGVDAGVGAVAAFEAIRACAAEERVVAAEADERIVAAAALDAVVVVMTLEVVRAPLPPRMVSMSVAMLSCSLASPSSLSVPRPTVMGCDRAE